MGDAPRPLEIADGPTRSLGRAVPVYPRMRSLVVALAGGALLALLSLPLAVSRFQSGAIFEGVAFAVLGLACAYGAAVLVAQLVMHRPIASLDEDGFACAAGSIAWSDVTEVSTYLVQTIYMGNRRELIIRIAPGAEVSPPDRTYLDNWMFGHAEVRGEALVLPTWTRKEDVLSAVRQFYDGPVEE